MDIQADTRGPITGTKRKLISRDVAGMDTLIPMEKVSFLALKYQLRDLDVRGFLISMGYRVPEPVSAPALPPRDIAPKPMVARPEPSVQPRMDQNPIKNPPAVLHAPSPEYIAGILKGAIYRQLGEGGDAWVMTTRAQFLEERAALLNIFRGNHLDMSEAIAEVRATVTEDGG